MAKKLPSSIIGVDLGRHSLKSVALQRKGANRFVLSHYAVRQMETAPETAEQLAAELKLLFADMGASAKACAVAVSSADSIIRILEQPETPTDILRDALRLNGLLLLNQDVKDFVLDCDTVSAADGEAAPANSGRQVRYLVAGLPRKQLGFIDDAFQACRKNSVHNIQLAPLCTFNAFEFANPDTFANQAFVLVDIGHTASTVTVGAKGEIVLVRSVEYGGGTLRDSLIADGAANGVAAMRALEEKDETTVEHARYSLSTLAREISSSIGFFEGRRDENIAKVFVSGGVARSKALLDILTEELRLPCEAWDPFQGCEISLPANRKPAFAEDFATLNVACGAAAEALGGRK